MSRRPALGAVRVAMAAAALALAVSACNTDQASKVATGKATLADSADQVIFGARTLITDGGLKRAEIRSDSAFFFDENTRVEMSGFVHGTFFSSQGAQDAILTSRTAMYNTRTGMLEARGDVVINSLDGRRLTTPFVRFDQRLNKIYSDSAFVMTEPGREVKGTGFVSDPDMNNIIVTHLLRGKTGAVVLPEK
jgi:LPS export ABC transporter protein LptC